MEIKNRIEFHGFDYSGSGVFIRCKDTNECIETIKYLKSLENLKNNLESLLKQDDDLDLDNEDIEQLLDGNYDFIVKQYQEITPAYLSKKQ